MFFESNHKRLLFFLAKKDLVSGLIFCENYAILFVKSVFGSV